MTEDINKPQAREFTSTCGLPSSNTLPLSGDKYSKSIFARVLFRNHLEQQLQLSHLFEGETNVI